MARDDFDDDGTVTIGKDEYEYLKDCEGLAGHVYDLISWAASEPDTTQLVTAQEFARNLIDEWTK